MTVEHGVVKIISTNTSSKNNSRSLKGVNIILRFLLESYKITELRPLWIYD